MFFERKEINFFEGLFQEDTDLLKKQKFIIT
jgi:hypothetical protein